MWDMAWFGLEALRVPARIVLDGLLAILLGLVIGRAYAQAYRGILLSTSFVHACAVTVLLVALAVSTVREANTQAEALSFALVGLLGLIRFRTVVRDTREFSFVFLAIVTGVMIGSGHEATAVLGCLAAIALLVALEKSGFGTRPSLALRVKVTGDAGGLSHYTAALSVVAERVDPISLRSPLNEKTAYTFEVVSRAGCEMEDIGRALVSVPGTSDFAVSTIRRGKDGMDSE